MENLLQLEYGVIGLALVTTWGALSWTVRAFISFLTRKDEEHVEERRQWLEQLMQLAEEHNQILEGLRRMNGKPHAGD